MKKRMRKTGLGILVGAVIVLGGGFASADYVEGSATAEAQATVTFTVQTFRAIELDGVSSIDFTVVRQGETSTIPGPTLLYGTTWPDDAVSVYLESALENSVKLYVTAGTATPPEDGSITCANEGAGAGVSQTDVNISATTAGTGGTPVISDEYLIRNINNCGAPKYDGGAPDTTEPSTWATATTSFTLDTTSAVQAGGASNLYAEVSRSIFFLIDADGD